MTAIEMTPIGVVCGGRKEAIDDHWGDVRSQILLDEARVLSESTTGLDAFSHIEVIFHFHRVAQNDIVYGARHPRGRIDWPAIGVFAQRAKNRPNRLGISICRLIRVSGLILDVQGLDAIDGTPVLDIKPWMRGFEPRGEIREPGWANELMREYW